MATRSGKRIHGSQLSENLCDIGVSHGEIKTRSKRNKDYEEDHLPEKKRKHYVKYPSEETTDDNESNNLSKKSLRKSTRNTLKERNILALCEVNDQNCADQIERKSTRRTKKGHVIEDQVINYADNSIEKKNKKKSKKKKRAISNENKLFQEHEDHNTALKKKSNKKKTKSRSSSFIVKDIDSEHFKPLNVSEVSGESFHSAASSPKANESNGFELNVIRDESTPKCKERVRKVSEKQISPIPINYLSINKAKNDSNKLNTSLSISNIQANKLKYTNLATDDKCQSELVNICDKQNLFEINHELEMSLTKHKIISRNASSDNVHDSFKENSSKKLKKSIQKTKKRVNKSAELCGAVLDTCDEIMFDPKANSETTFDKLTNFDTTFDKSEKNDTSFDKSLKLETTLGKVNKINTTLDKMDKTKTPTKKTIKTNTTFDKTNTNFNNAHKTNTSFEKINSTFDKGDQINTTFDKIDKTNTFGTADKTNTTFDKTEETNTTFENIDKTNTTFDKIDKTNTTFEKLDKTINEKSEVVLEKSISANISNDSSNDSLITSDTSKRSHISVTSDESHLDNLLNNSPLLVESSMDENNISKKPIPADSHKELPQTPLKREGTFTKDSPEISTLSKIIITTANNNIKTPTRRKSLPSPGCTPFPVAKNSKDKSVMNITHSIEKSRRSSLAEVMPRSTRVMFCSPSNNPVVVSQMKRKIIKSSLKGSNKSFIFEDTGVSSPARVGRKRSQTQEEAEPRAKRSRLHEERAMPLRMRSRTLSATARMPEAGTPSKKVDTPTKCTESRPARTKLPNFAALHKKQFAKMESLDECQERRARRAKQLLTPTGAAALLQRISPKGNDATKLPESKAKNSETPTKSKPALSNHGYSRFGFKLNLDNNPFSFTAKTETKPKTEPKLKRQVTLPSLAGATLSRREVAKQVVMREKSFVGKRDDNRKESRTVIKGVRTNRRFELQMKMRNINA